MLRWTMSSFGQFAATSQFYLYGRQNCTQTGYEKAVRSYPKPDLLGEEVGLDLSGRTAIVTGANSGIGLEVTKFLAQRNATVYMICRSEKRAKAVRETIVSETGNEQVHLLVCDCSLEADVRRAWEEFCQHSLERGLSQPQLDVLVCNAGVLMNDRTLTAEGVEITFACHLVFGTYLLTSLAIPTLEATAGSRAVIVSSAGMYNTKFPDWDVAASHTGKYDGNLAYAYAKRGQILLCEEWSKLHPTVKFVSSHPGWTETPAVDAAYGEQKKYLEPMRTPWQGAEGIVWLCVAPQEELEAGAFYLDRTARVKHLAGPFFSEGSFTKNSPEEVAAFMGKLQAMISGQGSAAPTNEELDALNAAAEALKLPLEATSKAIDIESFMGRWYVHAGIFTSFEVGGTDSTEDYVWNEKKKRIEVTFTMQQHSKQGKTSPFTLLQRAKIVNAPTNTRWSLSPKLGVYLPLGIAYLVLYCADDYSFTVIGARTHPTIASICASAHTSLRPSIFPPPAALSGAHESTSHLT